MSNPTPVKDDPKQLETAQSLWANFMQGSKYSIALVVFTLLALLVLFVPFG